METGFCLFGFVRKCHEAPRGHCFSTGIRKDKTSKKGIGKEIRAEFLKMQKIIVIQLKISSNTV